MNIELKPCPFCGGEAEMMGDQYPYVECQECAGGFTANHSYDADEGDAANKWNARSAAGRNLKPIAESKVRQLGGDVCGVLVRTQASEVMAVSEHGRCTRLDAGVMGPVDGAQGGQGAKPIGFTWDAGRFGRQFTADAGVADRVRVDGVAVSPVYTQPQPDRAQGGQGAEPVAEIVHDYNGISVQWLEPAKYGRFQSGQKLYTQPQAAMPEGWLVRRVDDRITVQHPDIGGYCASKDGNDHSAIAPVILYHFASALLSTPTTPRPEVESFQSRVAPWMQECFGPEVSADKVERNHRFLEESLELVQSLGCTKAEALQLVDYVYGRPAGDPPQEVGGVRVTLAALCLATGMDQDECAETELARIWTKVPQIRAKQAAKPKHSPLPQADGCPECGSTDLSWHTQSSVTNGTPDGKLRANEVSTLFVLGCGHCSETIKTLTAAQVAENMSPQPPAGREGNA
ncbi:Lar family restriction alleviation protein [Marinobacter nauticus]|uniref:Lar family restriction alleviation protein n=1 Tax=Marinobacter nauticus TaxID=2743 RepID=UPI000F1DFB83|nr:Lar family restriction alleviation protein [Marinobacter nauticus]RKR79223.1 restriction alleviation protein Lar [Marinobacter nauticus]